MKERLKQIFIKRSLRHVNMGKRKENIVADGGFIVSVRYFADPLTH